MSRVMHSPPGTDTEPVAEATAPRSVWRAFLVGTVLILLVIGGLLWAIRTFVFPTFEANSEANRQVATAQAQLATLQTQQALTPRPAPTVAAAPAGQLTPVATPAPTTAPAPQAAPTVAPTAAPTVAATVEAGPGALPTGNATTPLPTVPPALEAEVAQAYLHYFDVTSEALLNLDPSRLSEVATGSALAGLEQGIAEDRAQGRAVETNVQHDFAVLVVQGDEAIVADRYRDSSIFVNPDTHEPLPGQVVPASPDQAPLVKVLYYLQRIDGVWKVVRGEREP